MKNRGFKLLSIILGAVFLSACVTKPLYVKNIPDDSKVLVIANTSDVMALHYSGNKLFPIQRNSADFYVDITPEWKFSDLFVDYILSKQNVSRFKLIRGDQNNLRPAQTEVPYKFSPPSYAYPEKDRQSVDYQKLSEKYDVDYILILNAKNKFFAHGTGDYYYDYETAYYHYVHRPFFKLVARGHFLANFRIELIQVNPDDKNGLKTCFGNMMKLYKINEPMKIPNDFKAPFPRSEIDSDELNRIHEELKQRYFGIFDLASKNCLQNSAGKESRSHYEDDF